MKVTLLIATGNAGKSRKSGTSLIGAAAAAPDSFFASLRILGLKDLPRVPAECVEDQPTFEGNACKKAGHFAAETGLLTLADDSGLCVDALSGRSGGLLRTVCGRERRACGCREQCQAFGGDGRRTRRAAAGAILCARWR